MRSEVLIAAALTCGCVANDPMRRSDWALQASLAGMATVDALQTRHIIANDNEVNPFVGSHGQRMNPYAFGIMAFALELYAARMMPAKYRHAFEGFCLGVESYVVYSNFLTGAYPW